MARVTHVKRAQQRYATKPVLDQDGNQVYRTRTLKRPTKRGKTETRERVTERDLIRPLPNYKCDKCGTEIQPGQPYKWIKPKSGPYGGHMRTRCGTCPTWQVWDYSNSLSAQTARIAHDAQEAVGEAESAEDVTSALEAAAQEIRDLAEQKREGAQNIESGFGHATYQSEELEQTADDLDSWADDVESADITDLEDIECSGGCDNGQMDCDNCGGTGKYAEADCDECDGTGQVECDQCEGTGHDLDTARETWQDEISIVDECPV